MYSGKRYCMKHTNGNAEAVSVGEKNAHALVNETGSMSFCSRERALSTLRLLTPPHTILFDFRLLSFPMLRKKIIFFSGIFLQECVNKRSKYGGVLIRYALLFINLEEICF